MIFNYGFSVVGKSHIAKGNCCQDSHMIKELENGWVIAAVADGVGSAKNSQMGSSIAAKTVVEFCAECMPWDYSVIGIKSMLRTAYNYAFKQILKESEKTGEPIESYDTTLTTVIYDGHRIIYGHSGDGAIIGLTIYGDYVQITKPQKGVDMISVLPLRSGYTVWSIDSYEEELAAVMLMTDGMLDYTLCPYLLKLSNKSEVYTPIATYFVDPYGVPSDEKEAEKTKNDIKEFIVADDKYDTNKFYSRLSEIYKKHLKDESKNIIESMSEKKYACAFMQSVQDDKTMVALINTDIQFDTKEAEHFTEPNWDDLQEEWNKKAYPHLYATEEENNDENSETNNNEDIQNNGISELNKPGTKDSKETEIQNAESQQQVKEPQGSRQTADEEIVTPTCESTQYQGKTKEFVESKKHQREQNSKTEKKQEQQKNFYVPPITPTNTDNNSVESNAPIKHEKPRKAGLISKAAYALADLFGIDDE